MSKKKWDICGEYEGVLNRNRVLFKKKFILVKINQKISLDSRLTKLVKSQLKLFDYFPTIY